MPMIAITTSSSTSVKPERARYVREERTEKPPIKRKNNFGGNRPWMATERVSAKEEYQRGAVNAIVGPHFFYFFAVFHLRQDVFDARSLSGQGLLWEFSWHKRSARQTLA